MEKIHKKATSGGHLLPKKPTPPTPGKNVHSDDVERVLEHISSPFRWELLEVPPVQPKIRTTKKTNTVNPKPGSKR